MVEVKAIEGGSVFKLITFLQGLRRFVQISCPGAANTLRAAFDIDGKYLSQIKFNSASFLCQPML